MDPPDLPSSLDRKPAIDRCGHIWENCARHDRCDHTVFRAVASADVDLPSGGCDVDSGFCCFIYFSGRQIGAGNIPDFPVVLTLRPAVAGFEHFNHISLIQHEELRVACAGSSLEIDLVSGDVGNDAICNRVQSRIRIQ